MTVEKPEQIVAEVTQLAEGLGGWVVNSNTSTVGQQNNVAMMQGTISVRVPADKFATALEQIKAMAYSVDSQVITGDDVTQQYVDLQSQLTNLQDTQTQLQKIMATATNVNDVLAVQQRLTDVEGQIEQIKGQLQYFSQAAAFSLIALTLNQKPIPATPSATPTITPSPTSKPLGLVDWHPDQIASGAVDMLVSLGQALISLLIWLLIVALPFALIGLVIWFVARRFLKPAPKSGETMEK